MADTPDLSRIIGLIMENPSLIAEISALAKRDGGGGESAAGAEAVSREDSSEESPVSVEAAPEAAAAPTKESPARINRYRLLSAMKPYLSEGRCRAIDQMSALGEILDTMRRR